MRAVPMSLREGSYAMGATRFQTAVKVVVPAALSGLGLGIGLYVLFKVILGLGLKGLPPALMG